jgi:hypothetical protein
MRETAPGSVIGVKPFWNFSHAGSALSFAKKDSCR